MPEATVHEDSESDPREGDVGPTSSIEWQWEVDAVSQAMRVEDPPEAALRPSIPTPVGLHDPTGGVA